MALAGVTVRGQRHWAQQWRTSLRSAVPHLSQTAELRATASSLQVRVSPRSSDALAGEVVEESTATLLGLCSSVGRRRFSLRRKPLHCQF